MRIVLDAMGGDNAPAEIISGGVAALNEYPDFTLVLVGKREVIEQHLASLEYPAARLEIIDAREVIANCEPPVAAIKSKKDSSMVIGLELLRDKKADAFISAGSTGAVLSGALLRVGRIRGVQRPALSPILPTRTGSVALIDCGANMDCKPQYLEQFAIMGSVYMEKVIGVANPRVGLINVGVEEEKGNELVKSTRELLLSTPLNFVGNIEGRDIMDGAADVAVCDGFAGNLVLKSFEGVGMFIFDEFKKAFGGFIGKSAALLIYKKLKKLKKKLDYTEHGGAPLLGIDGVVIKAHGSSKAKSIKFTIRQAIDMVKGNMIEAIRTNISAAIEAPTT